MARRIGGEGCGGSDRGSQPPSGANNMPTTCTQVVPPSPPLSASLSFASPRPSSPISQPDIQLLQLVPARRNSKPLKSTGSRCGCEGPATLFSDAGTGKACGYYAAASSGACRLYCFDEAPQKLRFNRFIRSGYRAGLSYSQCCASLLTLHNETGNIYTHLLPAVVMLAILAVGSWEAWPGAQNAYAWNVASIWLCFVLSACYHTFCSNHHEYDCWLKLDVCGILLVLVGGGHVVLWWGLSCQAPALRFAWVVLYYSAGLACVHAALRATTALQRALPMLLLLLLRVGSFALRFMAAGHASKALQHYGLMEMCSLAGGLINALRVPERWLQPKDPTRPAPLDLIFNSHQLMHVLVACALLHLHLGATAEHREWAAVQSGMLSCATN